MGKIFLETKAAFLDNMKKNKHQKAESVIQNNVSGEMNSRISHFNFEKLINSSQIFDAI